MVDVIADGLLRQANNDFHQLLVAVTNRLKSIYLLATKVTPVQKECPRSASQYLQLLVCQWRVISESVDDGIVHLHHLRDH